MAIIQFFSVAAIASLAGGIYIGISDLQILDGGSRVDFFGFEAAGAEIYVFNVLIGSLALVLASRSRRNQRDPMTGGPAIEKHYPVSAR